MQHAIAQWATRIALIFFFFQLGGSFYEHLVIDRIWPANPTLIQPGQGGVDRKVFWIPMHGVVTLALPLALWAAWRVPGARTWLLIALGLYLVIRIWTFAYFIPAVARFEAADTIDVDAARAWVRWSLTRLPLLLGATWATWRALVMLGR